MNNSMRWSVRVLVLGVAGLVSVALAQDTLTVQNTAASAPMGGVYTSPYGISVNGTPTLLICDDFETDIYVGYSWQATPNTLTQISATTVSPLKFDSSPGSSAVLGGPSNVAEDYATAAVLSAELMTLPNFGTPSEDTETAGELSYAIWSVFDSSLYSSLTSTGSTGFGSLTTTEVDAVENDIKSAQILVAGATTAGTTNLDDISINGESITSLTVYTPIPVGASQEFLTVTLAEPPSPALLGTDLLALAGLILIARRRWASSAV
jgi:hypothetical protein